MKTLKTSYKANEKNIGKSITTCKPNLVKKHNVTVYKNVTQCKVINDKRIVKLRKKKRLKEGNEFAFFHCIF